MKKLLVLTIFLLFPLFANALSKCEIGGGTCNGSICTRDGDSYTTIDCSPESGLINGSQLKACVFQSDGYTPNCTALGACLIASNWVYSSTEICGVTNEPIPSDVGVPRDSTTECGHAGGSCSTGSCVLPQNQANSLSCVSFSNTNYGYPTCSSTLQCSDTGKCKESGTGKLQTVPLCNTGMSALTTATFAMHSAGATEATAHDSLAVLHSIAEMTAYLPNAANDIHNIYDIEVFNYLQMHNMDDQGNPLGPSMDSRVSDAQGVEAVEEGKLKAAATGELDPIVGFDITKILPLPDSGVCEALPQQTFHIPFIGYKVFNFDPCEKLAPLRQILYFAFLIITMISSFKIMTRGTS